ncbi:MULTISPECIES: ABC transporter ATP-binding protein [Niastella]|uniref:ABC transporter ATP-binding protein n=1 Tax=Niastella soli TaxID=2821487 RepID=A0ABS3YYJ7_9BACT|nr:AAA family ATPase [Niastella soli]MBO9202999.1 ABC transporter ATP-binding protein [Niastella soli]
MIHLHQVQKYYHDNLILYIPELKLDKGIYWIYGLNGSGKTTFLKILAGMIPFVGDAHINQLSLKKNGVEYRKLISFAEAEPVYPSYITGRDLVLFYQDIRKASQQQTDRLIAFSGLHAQLENPIGTYSSGMAKRLSLLLAFIGNPAWILLDEPLATLDTEAVHALPELINEYRQQYGTSFIFSSHQPFLSAALSIDKNFTITDNTIQPIP